MKLSGIRRLSCRNLEQQHSSKVDLSCKLDFASECAQQVSEDYGKSLCFQIPALLTNKIVMVISPLISLMHDQCLKLAKHGVSACFLGSGQPDRTIEYKAMCGMYKVVYVCPETIIRYILLLDYFNSAQSMLLIWKLSMLRENFNSNSLKSLQFDIPFMALTAMAINLVREDIIKSLHMSNYTDFLFHFQYVVKHSRTSSVSSYHKDFKELIRIYTVPRKTSRIEQKSILYDKDENFDSHSSECGVSDGEETTSLSDSGDDENENFLKRFKVDLAKDYASPKKHKLTVEYLEDELDNPQIVDDLDVSCGEFPGISPPKNSKRFDKSNSFDTQGTSVEGPTIIYVPTRKETLKIAEYLCRSGVKAAAYHAKLTKSHLRHVHDGFHQGSVQVSTRSILTWNLLMVVLFGPSSADYFCFLQSLEAYYQEAGRAGRDGKLADCTLYANLSRIPTLLPSQRSDEQTKQAYKMLSDCFR
ncbi:ATP-dependent DNA helicase Q-like SIM [Canna indica]|uniref:DNA 3'-5' helicase n=1 Tax=Canna indica TaxID=4628 RepID=A0AAQ3QA42_9LILI|nr:ATP-dependent DNA helicase Q-like SIM [Canna indica]